MTPEGAERLLEAANRRLLEARGRYQAWRARRESENCGSIGREPGAGEQTNLRKILKAVLRESKPAPKDENAELLAVWKTLCGEEVAAATRGLEYKNGFIRISVDSFVVRNELQNFLREALLEGMKEKFPGKVIRDLRFKTVKK